MDEKQAESQSTGASIGVAAVGSPSRFAHRRCGRLGVTVESQLNRTHPMHLRASNMQRRRALRGLLLCASNAASLSILALRRTAHAARVARVAIVNPHAAATAPKGTSAFKERLGELGYIEGKNLVLDSR